MVGFGASPARQQALRVEGKARDSLEVMAAVAEFVQSQPMQHLLLRSRSPDDSSESPKSYMAWLTYRPWSAPSAMTIPQPSSILSPYIGKHLPQKSDLAALLQDLRTALSNAGLDDYERAYAQTWLTRLFTVCEDDTILDEAGELLSLTVPALQTGRHSLTWKTRHS